MSKKRKKDIKKMITKTFSFIIMITVGAIAGAIAAKMSLNKGTSSQNIILELFIISISMLLAFFIQIIVHEAGHLICGLLSEYEFVSFRVGSFTLIKEDGKFAIKKFNIKGTGGQCLMYPKSDDYEKSPYILYNLGGVLMNAILTVLCYFIYTMTDSSRNINFLLVATMCMGIINVITNGIPMKIGGISNDGHNLFSIMKDKLVRYCFYTQLKVNGLMSKGMRIKDMPLKWFQIDEKSKFCTPLVTGIKMIEANYYNDKLEFDKARECHEFLLSYTPKILEYCEYEARCELLFYEIIGDRNEDKINELYTKKLKAYIKACKSHIGKLRIMYAYALIIEKDVKKVEKILKEIEKVKRTYPNRGELESELEIIDYIRSNF